MVFGQLLYKITVYLPGDQLLVKILFTINIYRSNHRERLIQSGGKSLTHHCAAHLPVIRQGFGRKFECAFAVSVVDAV